MDFEKTDEGLMLYIETLRGIAIENRLTIGWERPSTSNLFNYDIFVKDYHNNHWGDIVSTGKLDLSSLFEVWQAIEKLMIEVIKKR